MKIVLCDRCGKDCGDTYYNVKITARSDTPISGTSIEAASYNLMASLETPKTYCTSCRAEIEHLLAESIGPNPRYGKYRFNKDGSMTMTCCGKKTDTSHYGYPYCCFCGAEMTGGRQRDE